MKTLIKTIFATALMASFASAALAAVADDIRSVAGANGYINVSVYGNTVTLTGYVDDTQISELAEQTAKKQGFSVENQLNLPIGKL